MGSQNLEEQLIGPWPDWTKRAAARLLRILFPSTQIADWEKCFAHGDPTENLLANCFAQGTASSDIERPSPYKARPWEMWHWDGGRELHAHFSYGRLDGPRFQWDRHGRLSSIGLFRNGKLVGYESSELERHPRYEEAMQLLGTNAPAGN